jgi:hypothetical protein
MIVFNKCLLVRHKETAISMLKTFSLVSLAVGFVIVLALMTAAPETSAVEAQASEHVPQGCVAHEVLLDEGYGVSRKSVTLDCEKN